MAATRAATAAMIRTTIREIASRSQEVIQV